MKKLKALFFGLAMLSLIVVLVNPAQAADRVRVAWLPVTHALPFFVALEEGLYEEYGLEIEHEMMENPNHIIDGIVSGRIDAVPASGAAGIAALAASRFPDSLRVFGLQGSLLEQNRINDSFIVTPGSGITSFADLEGKRLATTPGIQWRTIARTVVRANGLDPDTDVSIVEMGIPLHAQGVASGNVDAALTLEPIGAIVEATGDVEMPIRNPVARFIVDPFYAGAAVMGTDFMRERPDVARRLIEATDRAVALVEEDFDRYRHLLIENTAVTEATVDKVSPLYYRSSRDLNETDIQAYQAFADIFYDDGVMSEPLDVNSLILRAADL